MAARIFDLRKAIEFSRWSGITPSETEAYEMAQSFLVRRKSGLPGWLGSLTPIKQVSAGTATGGSTTTLEDTAATFVTDGVEVGWTVQNMVDDEKVLIVSVDSETSLTVETAAVTLSGKAYKVKKPVRYGVDPSKPDKPWLTGFLIDEVWEEFPGDAAAIRKRQKNLAARYVLRFFRVDMLGKSLTDFREATEPLGTGADAETPAEATARREAEATSYADALLPAADVNVADDDEEEEV